MHKPAVLPGRQIDEAAAHSPQQYREVALSQRQMAEQATLPRLKEQLLRSAEKWEFLAERHEIERVGRFAKVA